MESTEQVVFKYVLDMPKWYVPFVRNATDVEYAHRMREVLRIGISSESNMVDLSYCCSRRPLKLFYLIREVKTSSHDLDLDLRQRSKGLLVGWHIIEPFAVPPARRGLVHAKK